MSLKSIATELQVAARTSIARGRQHELDEEWHDDLFDLEDDLKRDTVNILKAEKLVPYAQELMVLALRASLREDLADIRAALVDLGAFITTWVYAIDVELDGAA